MAWTTPRTWVTGEVVTAGMMNTYVRDDFNVVYNSGPRMGGGQSAYALNTFTASGAYAAVGVADMARIVLPDAKAIYDEGFTPQTRVAGFMKNSSTNVTRLRPSVFSVSDNEAGATSIGTGTEIATANANGADTFEWEDSGWQDLSVTPGTDTDWILIAEAGTTAATGTYLDMLMGFRWK